jgi:putative pyruvate formate lyase activating enzyme
VETLRLLDGLVDIYLADMRYASSAAAATCSSAPDYPSVNRSAVAEMWRQAGPLVTDEQGIAQKGLIVRHLVLPEGLAGTEEILRFLAESISREVTVSLMSQYVPCHKAVGDPLLGRRVTAEEYAHAGSLLFDSGLQNGWIQEMKGDGDDETLLGTALQSTIPLPEDTMKAGG